MKRVLAVLRRLFGGGLIAFAVAMALKVFSFNNVYWISVKEPNFTSIFSFFLLCAPVLYILFLIVSYAYIRKRGQFAAYQQTTSFGTTFMKCVGSDLASPFKCFWGFISGTVFGKFPEVYPDDLKKKSRRISCRRFIWMILVIAFLAFGLWRLYSAG